MPSSPQTYTPIQSLVRLARLGYLYSAGSTTGRLFAFANASIICACESVLIVVPMDMKKLSHLSVHANYLVSCSSPYPNVAAEPAIYCPKVRIMPFGPGPKRIMFVAPNIKPMIRPTAVAMCQRDLCAVRHGKSSIHPPIIAPILTVDRLLLARIHDGVRLNEEAYVCRM